MPTARKRVKPKPTPTARLRRARRVIAAAQEHASGVMANVGMPRSTRTRTAYKVKATALDRVGEILAGKVEA
jgi:hypothetical protein